MGHRLTIGVRSWQASVSWRGTMPTAAELSVDTDSLTVVKGEGGVTPLTPPERALARSNALKSLDAKKYPLITFSTEKISKTPEGYQLAGTLEIHGTSRPHTVDLRVEDLGDRWSMTARVAVTQSDFGVKPYSLMMGALKVADEVIIDFAGTHPA
ncbi:MAG: YceI family protein [Mycobacterium sp.]|jgi:polyisoprenoid-binding protein YceI|nr:YceI family protein [Mycobacterium sp.]